MSVYYTPIITLYAKPRNFTNNFCPPTRVICSNKNSKTLLLHFRYIVCAYIPLLTPLIDPNWINSELAIALVKIFK